MPTVDGLVTLTKIGADFCVSFSNPPSVLQINCNDVKSTGADPPSTLFWYKDDVLAFTGEGPGFVPNEEFYNIGNNGLLRFGVLDPPPLVVLPGDFDGSQLLLNFLSVNASSPALLPPGVDVDNIAQELFDVLLGNWECRVNNTYGEDSAVTELTDCGKAGYIEHRHFVMHIIIL